MDVNTGMMRSEMLQVADAVAREKNIEREEVLEAMEEAIRRIARTRYGQENDIRADIDRRTGEIHIRRYRTVVEEVEEESQQLTVDQARREKPDAKVGDELIDDLPPIEFGRVAAQTAKQVVMQRVREAEREKQFAEFIDRKGEIINGIVKREEYGNVTVDLGKAEGLLRRDEIIPREKFNVGDRVTALILDVRREVRGPQIFLSRTHPDFMVQLFRREVQEIYDNTVEIKAVARDPGSRAKIAVISYDSGVDPVGACVGMRGVRVQAVVGELQGEKVDIIPWTEDPARFVISAIQPAAVAKVVLDEEAHRMDVVVPEDQQSLAIGRRGQNVKLASMLTGWDITILTEEQEEERRSEELREYSELFMEALDVDDVIAHLLVAEGFSSVYEISDAPLEDLAEIEGFDEEVAEELRNRALSYIDEIHRQYEERLVELGVTEELLAFDDFSPEMLVALGENEVRTLDDLADLAGDELQDIVGEANITLERANEIIMACRAHWFEDEETAEAGEGDPATADSAEDVQADQPGAEA